MDLRITSCELEAFGPFSERTVDLDHPVVVVRGDNEAGKTSLFHFLQAMLYGIYPTDLDRHPYAPRSGTPLSGSLDVRVGEERAFTVSRRLKSSPQGRLVERRLGGHEANVEANGEASTDLRNRTVPAVQHVPQAVFESVYALRLDDLVAMEGSAWDEVQDRLLGSLSVDHIRSARAVVNELEDEATDRWRTDNRGKPAAKELEARRRELRDAAREAKTRDAEIRRLRDEVAQLDARIEDLQDEQVELKAAQHRAERLLPVRRLLRQIDRLEDEAGDRDELDALPADPRERLDDLTARIEDLDTQLDEKKSTVRRLKSILDARTEEGRRLLDHADAIRGWTRRIEGHQSRRADLDDAVRARDRAEAELEDAAEMLSGGWREEVADPVRALSMADLRERVRAYEDAEQRLRETEARAETVALHATARKSTLPWVTLGVLGVIVTVFGLLTTPLGGITAAGGALVLVGVLQTVAAVQHNRQLDAQEEQLDLAGRRAEAEERAEQVQALLREIPVPSERLERPSGDLVQDLEILRDALRTVDRRRAAVEEQHEALEAADADLRALADDCGLDAEVRDRPAPELVEHLADRLDRAQERHRRAEDAKAELPGLREEVEALVERLTDLRDRRDALTRRLETLGDGDVEAGIERLADRRDAARRADAARDRLHTEYPDWEARRDEIEALEAEAASDGKADAANANDADEESVDDFSDDLDVDPNDDPGDDSGADSGETWGLSDEDRARIEQRLDAVADALREADRERTARQKDAEHLQEQPTASEIESELAHVNRRLDDVERERDRRMLLARIVDRADTQFRRKHQPDVVRRASAYLTAITQTRYERLALEDGRLVVYETGAAFPRPVGPPLSQGTLDQIYLAIRLAIIDHLDADRERLPVFFDEVFVNWDQSRRRAAFDILADMAEERQLFFFTCHPLFAREITRHLDADTVDLGAPAVPAEE